MNIRATLSSHFLLLILVSGVSAQTPAAPVQGPTAADTGSTSLLVRLGRDTIAVERYRRTETGIEGELLRRVPATHVIRYSATLDEGGRPQTFEFDVEWTGGRPAPNAVRGGRIEFGPDSAHIKLRRDDLGSQSVPTPLAYPALPESYGLHELWLGRLRRTGSDSMTVATVAPLGGPSGRMQVSALGGDTVTVPMFGAALRLRADGEGTLLEVDGMATAVKYEVDRIDPANIAGLATRFARADAEGGAMGTWISPHDTVTARLGGATLRVDYGRPAARGREVFGHGVLGDTLWRTGANAATQLHTDTDLDVGGARVPAGSYTLWTHYDDGQAALIVNTQTGQWGTQYDRTRDLVRVPLRVGTLDGPLVELFTIRIRPLEGTGRGVLELLWDRTVMSVDLEPAG